MDASREEMVSLRKAIYPLTRKLACSTRSQAQARSQGPAGLPRHGAALAVVRRACRPSRSSVPAAVEARDLRHRRHLGVGGGVRGSRCTSCTRSGQFSKVRAFVFIDGIDEVTSFFEGVDDIGEAVHRVNTEADVVWVDGHSDYGHALEVFWNKWGREIGPKTTVMVLGDARNNYHASQAWVLKEMQKKARHVYWLNPEPRAYWDTGDSIVGEYGVHSDGVFECRNLRSSNASSRTSPERAHRDPHRPRPSRRVAGLRRRCRRRASHLQRPVRPRTAPGRRLARSARVNGRLRARRPAGSRAPCREPSRPPRSSPRPWAGSPLAKTRGWYDAIRAKRAA